MLPLMALVVALALLFDTGRLMHEALARFSAFLYRPADNTLRPELRSCLALGRLTAKYLSLRTCHRFSFPTRRAEYLLGAGLRGSRSSSWHLALWHTHSQSGRDRYRRIFHQLTSMKGHRSNEAISWWTISRMAVQSERRSETDCPRQKPQSLIGSMPMAMDYYTKFDTARRQAAALFNSDCVQQVPYSGMRVRESTRRRSTGT